MLNSKTQYQIRINGSFACELDCFDKYSIEKFAEICRDNPNDFVDVVFVRTEILMNQFSYHQMQRHFMGDKNE